MRKIGRPTIEPLTMTAEYEASIRKASERASSVGQVPNMESLPGQRRALLDEVDHLRIEVVALREVVAAADVLRTTAACGCPTCRGRRSAYDAARATLGDKP
jgi:hypothetical protein